MDGTAYQWILAFRGQARGENGRGPMTVAQRAAKQDKALVLASFPVLVGGLFPI